MDKKKVIIGALIVVVLLVLCIVLSPKNNADEEEDYLLKLEKESASIKDSEKKQLINMDVASYLEKYDKDEKIIVLITREDCPYCLVAIPFIQKVAKDYDLDIYSIDTSKFTEEDTITFVDTNVRFKNNVGTPFLMIVQNGEILGELEGMSNYEEYVNFFKTNQIIV